MGFTLSKLSHLQRAYLVTVCIQSLITDKGGKKIAKMLTECMHGPLGRGVRDDYMMTLVSLRTRESFSDNTIK